MTRFVRWIGIACLPAVVAMSLAVTGAGASTPRAEKPGAVHVIGNFAAPDDGPDAPPYYANGAELAVADLRRRGDRVDWERVPVSGGSAIAAQEAFLASTAKDPDAIIGFAASSDLIPVGPRIAATDVPVIALSAPTEAVRSGPSGGDNVFLIRPLVEQTYGTLVDFICTDFREREELKDVKVALDVVDGAFGPTVQRTVEQMVGDRKRCDLVTMTTSAFNATDLGEQVAAIRDSGANVVLTANYPAPTAALVNQLRQGGVAAPVVGGTTLGLAVDGGSVEDLDGLWASDDCVPELERSKTAKRFVKAYTKRYGAAPNYAAAQVYDALHLLARDVAEVGHRRAEINEALARTSYRGVCEYANDSNNVLASSVTIYRYEGATDSTKVRVEKRPLVAIPGRELVFSTPTTVPAG